ncbi:biopolymer transport protein TolR [Alcanivorax xiamenensis]|uniref:Tol-Pal system protein TolR n=2 Tax=Alcanivoracaceae TaxID=224372 RepID=A0ABQ6Y2Q2_9GAMM|nr:biopolymer transport protein TolR [Alcanivorax xiamenensis]
MRAPRKLSSEMNVVPYIDVMLVLLVIFMATAPMMTQGVSVDLPQANSAPLPTENDEPVMIAVAADGGYYINVGDDSEAATDLEALTQRVIAIHNEKPETLFLVRGDQNVPYGKVVVLMSELQGAGVTKLGLVTDPAELP